MLATFLCMQGRSHRSLYFLVYLFSVNLPFSDFFSTFPLPFFVCPFKLAFSYTPALFSFSSNVCVKVRTKTADTLSYAFCALNSTMRAPTYRKFMQFAWPCYSNTRFRPYSSRPLSQKKKKHAHSNDILRSSLQFLRLCLLAVCACVCVRVSFRTLYVLFVCIFFYFVLLPFNVCIHDRK